MATFISTLTFTEQGLRNIRQTRERAEAFGETAKQVGASVTDVFWTLGSSDGVIIFDAPDDETATALMLRLGAQGNVRPRTERAFRASEIDGVLGNVSS